MELDDMKNVWQQELVLQNRDTDFASVRQAVDKYDRKARFSWLLEISVGVLLVVLFGGFWLAMLITQTLHPLAHLGLFALVAGCAFVVWKIVHERKVTTNDDWTLSAKLDIQIEKREKEIKLLKSVAYWYLAPLFVGIVLGTYGLHVNLTEDYLPGLSLWGYWALCLLLYVGIYFFNQHALKTKVRPVLEQLYGLRAELGRDA